MAHCRTLKDLGSLEDGEVEQELLQVLCQFIFWRYFVPVLRTTVKLSEQFIHSFALVYRSCTQTLLTFIQL
jgi:hypothetical protein